MKKNNKKKKLMAAAAALALIAAISGTFAWITAQDQRINRAESAAVVDDSVTINELWEPKPLVAGTTAKKEVSVSNTGTSNVFVRLSYEEVLKHLDKLGAEKADPASVAGAKYTTYTANDPGLGKHMPINFNGAKAFDDGFKVVPAAQITGLTLPADDNVKLLVKGTRTVDPTTGKIGNGFEAKLMHEYFADPFNTGKDPNDPTSGYDAKLNKYQKMTYNISMLTDNGATDAKDWDFELRDVKYAYYEDGYKNKVVNWAKSSLPDAAGRTPGAVGNEQANALLGTAGKRYNEDYDYTPATLGLAGGVIPPASITTATAQIPTAIGPKAVQADTSALSKSAIKIDYSGAVVDLAGLAAATDNWIYNEEDGWFYYTQPLTTGATTADLLKNLIFESDMGTEYTNASYDLVVKLEAIQATKEALTDAAGWKLDTTPATNPITKAICDKLAP
ncbi:hypothetical protein [Candidatus Enterococcus ferrettii]|uniref:Alternate signal-mediated exported protein, CPF_0494 family n=1 Tax=Candidatus Enterococcus ferrettii TaxID=2815324 RepID=A0ABV0EJN6_9ENTE|nr:hypothetical protein [Enterococcus sp. 665A]MBO1339027.1 hypothetical protein [Enterococcus sp. 665A]